MCRKHYKNHKILLDLIMSLGSLNYRLWFGFEMSLQQASILKELFTAQQHTELGLLGGDSIMKTLISSLE
jgi:hypothetical protein